MEMVVLANRGEICTHAHLAVLETALDHVFELGLDCHFHRLGFWCSLWLGRLRLDILGHGVLKVLDLDLWVSRIMQ